VDIHKTDLQIYKSISTYPSEGVIPPLLVAFILDTSEISSNQALLWNRPSGRSTLDATMIGKGKGKQKEGRSGIVLERWTFQARYAFCQGRVADISTASYSTSDSQTAPHTAYRMGIIHFRALYALLRMLPAYNLHRQLRRANNGLKLGLKLWAPEGYPNSEAGLREAWEVMEQDLIGLDTGLNSLTSSEIEPDLENKSYDFPPLELFGNEYNLSVDYRPEVDIHVEDLESVLSEKFVDMEEDWFTPTVARHRLNEGSLPSSVASSNPPSRRVATPTAIPYSNPAPIPQRQGPASIGSFQSAQQGVLPGSRNRQASSQSQKEPVSERWGQIGEGLPFATGTQVRIYSMK
jgi:autophagy-related protein 13